MRDKLDDAVTRFVSELGTCPACGHKRPSARRVETERDRARRRIAELQAALEQDRQQPRAYEAPRITGSHRE